ncbi:Selenium-dependent molybdenum hydroxylase system protein, YqeB family [Tepidanaerobacter acetatoxydans Re1]|uniref:Selenium-dependent molybdenum hydroxylase system protein, YqeB family n=1 Tax=Tepidanaerobacter acetatoxydans (strain DSM 21804 / JCM 16047 / Re1) TaxID=1209989 RepID=F4LUQ3_TEPAE|nr:selenium-dependent molybdenum cofactor biosynthesis protein YqeB [Tepidanaerobacter acetatoxydans]AEE90621.1 selenium-dependent molybdenum hydroxylase system protein, YqeB family [Tepidanaerobacter acetatoxydans Re1]CDI40386.1 Selenium-dependent molybdenum hydroxylase system protein, YqeB family [Tepidanaerobacter acetatoxydans Re1]
MQDLVVLIKGAGEMASAVAHRLYRSGFQIIMTEVEKPLMVRRHVSFGNCIFEGNWQVEGVESKQVRDLKEIRDALAGRKIPVLIDEKCEISRALSPNVIVDAILAKKNTGTTIKDAQVVIGLGPGFEAGKDVHAVIETMRGHDLGRVILKGAAQKNTGTPGPIQGITDDRVLRAPRAGVVKNILDIGSLVKKGDIIGSVADRPVFAKIDGVLRGLIYDGLTVIAGQKIGDIDPRGQIDYCNTISDKGRTISGGVLEAILFLLNDVNP